MGSGWLRGAAVLCIAAFAACGPAKTPRSSALRAPASAEPAREPSDAGSPSEAPPIVGPHRGGADIRLLALLEPLFAGSSAESWADAQGRRFAFSTRSGPTSAFPGLVAIPKAAEQAAREGRTLVVAEVWASSKTGIARANQFLIGSGSDGDGDSPHLDVELDVQVASDGALSILDRTCTQVLANLHAQFTPPTTFEAFDLAVIPAVCGNVGRYTWKTSSFERAPNVSPMATEETLKDLDGAIFLTTPITEGSLLEFIPTRVWRPSERDLSLAFGLVERLETAANNARALAFADVWVGRSSGLSRGISIPTGLRTRPCTPPLPAAGRAPDVSREARCVVFELNAFEKDGAVLVEDTAGECDTWKKKPTSPDGVAVAKLCAGRGRYTWDGKTFVRSMHGRVGERSR